jgi:hypothetical protein
MKKNYLIILLGCSCMYGQNVGINTNGSAPNTSAILDLNTGNTYTNPNGKGLIIPNLALTATNASAPVSSPATSLLVYNTATASSGSTAVYPGYYYWDGTKWVAMAGNGGKDWALLGNGGITTPAAPATYGTSTIGASENWLGTTDANDLTFGTNNIERMRIKQSTGNVGIGLAAPSTMLEVAQNNTIKLGNSQLSSGGTYMHLAQNAWFNGSAWQFPVANQAGALIQISSNVTNFYTHNGAGTFTQNMTILGNGNVGIGSSATAPNVKLAIAGNGTNVYATDLWVDDNAHVQGNETVGTGRGRLRVGTAWGYVGMYAETNSAGATNDLILGASSALTRVGPTSGGQNLRVSGLESSGNRMVMADANGTLFLGSGNNQGYGGNIQNVTLSTCQVTSTTTFAAIPGMSITFTPVHNTVYVYVSCSGRYTNNTGLSSGLGSAFGYLRVYNVTTSSQAAIAQGMLSAYDGTGATVSAGYIGIIAVPVSVTAGSSVTLRVDWFLGRVDGTSYFGICPTAGAGDHLSFTIID